MASDEEPQPDPGEQVASPDEVRDALRSLSEPDHRRLAKAARLFMRFHPALAGEYEAGDLLQMAVLAALQGTRKWPKNWVDFVKFLAETMRSIASNESRKLREGMQTHTVPEGEGGPSDVDVRQADALENAISETPTPDQALLQKEHEAESLTKITLLRAQFADDEEIARIFELQLAGLSKREIRERLGMDSTRFWTADRRLTRRIEQIMQRLRTHDCS
jgi:hypothetical protein